MIVLPEAEKRTIVSSFIWTKHRNVTEWQTDGLWLWLLQRVCIAFAVIRYKWMRYADSNTTNIQNNETLENREFFGEF